jgi:hypothetical protein
MRKFIIGGLAAFAMVAAPAAVGGAVQANAGTPDQEFLNLVHSNGVGGQDDSLIAFAHEFCDTNGPYGTVLPLAGQGVLPTQIYTVRVAASRVYCPDKIAVPVAPPQVFTGLTR